MTILNPAPTYNGLRSVPKLNEEKTPHPSTTSFGPSAPRGADSRPVSCAEQACRRKMPIETVSRVRGQVHQGKGGALRAAKDRLALLKVDNLVSIAAITRIIRQKQVAQSGRMAGYLRSARGQKLRPCGRAGRKSTTGRLLMRREPTEISPF